MPLGEPDPVTPLFTVPFFFGLGGCHSQGCHGYLPRLTCGTYQFHHAPSTHPSIADGLMWLNVI